MCIIIFDNRDKNRVLDRGVLERAAKRNPDGMGIMYALKGKLYTWSTLDDLDGIWKRYAACRARGLSVAMHFRIATIGSRRIENCHPFRVSDGLAVMHNGTMSPLKALTDKENDASDSRIFASEVASKLPKDFLADPALMALVRALVGSDRMLFMDRLGNYSFVNEYGSVAEWRGQKRNGVWLSHKDDFVWEGDKQAPAPACALHEAKEATAKGTSLVPYAEKRSSAGLGAGTAVPFGHKSRFKPAKAKKTKCFAAAEALNWRPGKSGKARRKLARRSRILENIVFSYGSFRTSLREFPNEFAFIGTGVLKDAQLWAVRFDGGEEAGVIEGISGSAVHGELFLALGTKRNVQDALAYLDEDEGAGEGGVGSYVPCYRRHLTRVSTHMIGVDEPFTAWVYYVNSKLATLVGPVPNGDWSEWVRRSKDQGRTGELSTTNTPRTADMTRIISSRQVIYLSAQQIEAAGDTPIECHSCRSLGTDVVLSNDKWWLFCYDCRTEFPIKVSTVLTAADSKLSITVQQGGEA